MSCHGTRIDQESSLAQHTARKKPGNKSAHTTSILHGYRQKFGSNHKISGTQTESNNNEI